jgi:hypothetical protein
MPAFDAKEAANLKTHLKALLNSSNHEERELAELLLKDDTVDSIFKQAHPMQAWTTFKTQLQRTNPDLFKRLYVNPHAPLHQIEQEYFSFQEEVGATETPPQEGGKHEKKQSHGQVRQHTQSHAEGAIEVEEIPGSSIPTEMPENAYELPDEEAEDTMPDYDFSGESTNFGGFGFTPPDIEEPEERRDDQGGGFNNPLDTVKDAQKFGDWLNGGGTTSTAGEAAGSAGTAAEGATAAGGGAEAATAGSAAGSTAGLGTGAGTATAAGGGAVAAGAPAAAAGGGAAGGALAAIGGALGVAAPFILAGLFILVIIVIFALILASGGHPILPTVQVGCADDDKFATIYADSSDILLRGGDLDKQIFQNYFKLHWGAAIGPDSREISKSSNRNYYAVATQDVKVVVKETCLLFGHVDNGQLHPPGFRNTFGTAVTGNDTQLKSHTPYEVQVNMIYGADTAGCSVAVIPPASNTMNINFINLDHCQSDAQMQFVVGRGFAQALYFQQQHLNPTNNPYQEFINETITIQNGQEFPLPAPNCLLAVANPKPDSKNFDGVNQNCFADTVGAYFVYPSYPVEITQIAHTNPCVQAGNVCVPKNEGSCSTQLGANYTSTALSCDTSNNTCCTNTKQKPTPLPTPTLGPTQSPVQYPLKDFPSGRYDTYYRYAKYNLFDQIELFMLGQQVNTLACPTQLDTTDPAQIAKIINDTYGFRVVADSSVNTTHVLTLTYNTLCQLWLSKTFANLVGTIDSHGQPSQLVLNIHAGACGTGNELYIPNLNLNYCSTNDDSYRFMIAHELGHVIMSRHASIVQDFQAFFDAHGRQLPTDNCQCATPALSSSQCAGGVFGSHPNHECYADMVGEYLTFTTYKHSATTRNKSITFSEYPQKYSDWYTWANQHIFGGTEYTGFQTGNSLSTYATKLAQDIIHVCPNLDPNRQRTIVDANDASCLSSLAKLQYPSSVIQILQDHILLIKGTRVATLQCVGFAKAVALGAKHALSGSYGDAKNYAGTSQPGYIWYAKSDLLKNGGVKVGDIAIFNNALNHIAVVVSVVGNGTKAFDVAEANGGSGSVDITKGGNYGVDNNFAGVFRLAQ